MSDVNQVVLSGRLTADPVRRATKTGKTVANFRIASNRFYADKEETVFIDVTVWNRAAEAVLEYLRKGSMVLVTGRLEYDVWEDRDGKKRTTYRIQADRVTFLERPRKQDGKEAAEEAAEAALPEADPFGDDVGDEIGF